VAIGVLQGMRVAILATDGFEETELLEPRRDLENAGAATFIVAPAEDKIKGWNHQSWGRELPVDIPLKSAKAEDFHALFLPGEVMNPDQLRKDQEAVRFVKDFVDLGKPVGATNHGLGIILEAGAVQGRTMTSWLCLESDFQNAGTNWVDREVVCDRKLVTSRGPDDIPAFDREMIRLFAAEREHSIDMRKFY
jgi:protease I